MTAKTIPTTDDEIAALEAAIEEREKEQEANKEKLQKAYDNRRLGRIRQVNDLIAKLDLTVEDMASVSLVELAIKRALKGTAKAPATGGKGNASTYVKPPAKWRFTDGSEYGGGRGPVPQWVETARANGTIDNYLIDKPAKAA